jgi:dTDP-4-dehydrorhamnose 3,5-epimerase
MLFHDTPVEGAYVIEPHRITDDRGFFARLWCTAELGQRGLSTTICQTNIGVSTRKGTLRGLHYQRAPHAEVKIVRCPRGAVFDVVVDLRPQSPTYLRSHGVELNQDNGLALYVPEGCATGYLTLTDDAEIYYHTSATYNPGAATGVRFNDPAFGIAWPGVPTVMSAQDAAWPLFNNNVGTAS